MPGAKPTSIASHDHRQLETPVVTLLKRMTQILGLTIPAETVQAILTPLGFGMAPGSEPDTYKITIPTFRSHDVYREIDIIEEIIRIYGYDRIPYTLPQETAAPVRSFRARTLDKIREVMTASGLTEVLTLSLIGDALLEPHRLFPGA